MKKILLLGLIFLAGCAGGETPEEKRKRIEREIQQATSELNLLADAWDGKLQLDTQGKKDPWGSPYLATVTEGALNNCLEVRSGGPDGLLKNKDDIVVYRFRRHGKTTINKEVERGAESISRGWFRGMVQGAREGWNAPPKDKKDIPKEKEKS